MFRTVALAGVALMLALAAPGSSRAYDIKHVVKCQKKFARSGAQFAKRVIKANLKCTTETSLCIIQCEGGVFGPCDSNDTNSNEAFGLCMDDANLVCAEMVARIANWEIQKQISIINACNDLTNEELCGADAAGLNFAVLAAGCDAIIPNFNCNLLNLISCVGGPLERTLADQISALLNPRAADGLAVLDIESSFPGIQRVRKDKGDVLSGSVDVWSIDALAGEEFMISVTNRDDNGDETSNVVPTVLLLGTDGQTPVAETVQVTSECRFPSSCGNACPQFSRRLPFSGTYYLEIGAASGCAGGKYKVNVHSPRGSKPTLVADDIAPGTFTP